MLIIRMSFTPLKNADGMRQLEAFDCGAAFRAPEVQRGGEPESGFILPNLYEDPNGLPA